MSPVDFALGLFLGCLVLLTGMGWLSLRGEDRCQHCGSVLEGNRPCECTRPSRKTFS